MALQREIFGVSNTTLLLFLSGKVSEGRTSSFCLANNKFSQIFHCKIRILFYFFQDTFLFADKASAGEQGDKDKNSFSFHDNLPDFEITS